MPALAQRVANALFWRPVAAGLRAAGVIDRPPSDMEVLRSMRAEIAGGMKAADTGRLAKSWTTSPIPIDAVLRDGLATVRARAREQALNNDYDNRFDLMVRSNVVGPKGIRLQMQLKTMDGKVDQLANDAIERAWAEWGRPENCDVTGEESWTSIQQTFISTVRRDGEGILRFYEGPGAGAFGIGVQLLDPELLDTQYHDDLANGHRIRFGVELDRRDRPVAYHFTDETTSRTGVYAYGYSLGAANAHIRVPRDQVIHGFVRRHVGQKRGIPWSATALFRMKMLEGYEEAAVIAARVGAAKMGFIKSEDGRGLNLPTSPTTGAKTMKSKPGSIDELPPNTSFQAWDPAYPHEQFGDFVKSQLRGIASGLGVSYNTLANDLEGVTFSSLRASILEDREVWRTLQTWTADKLLRPTFDRWILWAVMNGKVVDETGGRFPIHRVEAARRAARFVPRGWAWVDPYKEAKAASEAIANGTGTRSKFIREAGEDPMETFEEAAFEEKVLAELGISRNAGTAGVAADPMTEEAK